MKKFLTGLLVLVSSVVYGQHAVTATTQLTGTNTPALKEYRLNDGDSEYLTIPHGSDINFNRTSTFTIIVYVKFESTAIGSVAMLYSRRAASAPLTGIQFFKSAANFLQFVIAGTSVQSATLNETNFPLVADQYYSLAVVYNGSPTDVKFYINGKDGITNIAANNLTSENTTLTNSTALIGSRLNTPIYSDMSVGMVQIFNRALTVNEIPDKMWNYGRPNFGTYVTGCIRDYRMYSDTFNGSEYILKDYASGANGITVNMAGTELIGMNSVATPTPLGIQASPSTMTENFIGWDSSGKNCKYDVEVSDNGTTGWTVIASNIDQLSYNHVVGVHSTLKYYRARARGDGTVSSYSDVVSATTLSNSYPNVRYYNTRRQGDNSYNFGLSVETQRVAPQAYYDSQSNRTYFVFMSRAEQGYDMAIFAYFYDHASATFSDSKYVGLKSRQGLDRHPIPAIIVADDGHIIVAFTDFHNAPMQIFRSDNPGSIDAFTRIGELGSVTDYAELRKLSTGRIVLFCRYYASGATLAGIGYFYSDDHGLTWTSLEQVIEYNYVDARPYPLLMPQTEGSDRIHLLATPRNDTGGPFPLDPDKVGYFKDYGYTYSDDLITWRSAGNLSSRNVVASGPITEVPWTGNYLYHDSNGTEESGQPVGVVTVGDIPYIVTYDDTGVYKCHYWNGASWTHQTITWSDGNAPSYFDGTNTYQSFTFGYHGVQSIIHVSGTTFDIYCTEDGVVKWYRTTDNFANATLQNANFLPDVSSLDYERGTTTHNIYQATEPFLFYSIKKSVPTPDPTSPGAWSDIVFIKLWQ